MNWIGLGWIGLNWDDFDYTEMGWVGHDLIGLALFQPGLDWSGMG